MFRSIAFFVSLTAVLATPAYAEVSAKADRKALRKCPRIIANLKDGTFARRSEGDYRCFKRSRGAERAGFFDSKLESTPDLEGQWKLTVTLTEDTCGDINTEDELTAIPNFLRVTQEGSRITGVPFPDPNQSTYIGAVTGNGFVATDETPMFSECEGGVGKYTIVYQLRDIVGEEAHFASYSLDKVCKSEIPGESKSCRTTFIGKAVKFEMDM